MIARRILSHCSAILLTVSIGHPSFAGVGRFSGDERCDWETHTLVIARVIDNGYVRDKIAYDFVTLDIAMTLAGKSVCVRQTPLKCEIPLGTFGTPLISLPPKESMIIALLCSTRDGTYYVPFSYVAFMPEGYPAYQVDGIHDPLVTKTIGAVSERRRKAEAVAERLELDCAAWTKFHYPEQVAPQREETDVSWRDRTIVYAEVRSKTLADDGRSGAVKLTLLGTLTGPLDPALVGEITLNVEESEKSLGKTRLFDVQDTIFVSLAIEDGKYVLHRPKDEPLFSESPLFRCDKPTDDHIAKVVASLRESFAKRHPQANKKD